MAFKIAYGAGHYLGTPGKRLPKELDSAQTREWTLNDRVARHFAEAAKQYADVETLRVDDATGKSEITLANRCKKANDWDADFCLAIHHNAGVALGSGGGIEAYAYKEGTSAAKYRDAIYEACIAAGGLKGNRSDPTRAKRFYVLVNTDAPAALIEYGYMDSTTDAPVILTDAYAKKVAYATMDGIAKIAGLKKKATSSTVTPPKTEKPAAKKSVEEIAKEVLAGKWGNGETRKAKLKAAGYDYSAVQAKVNELAKGKKPVATKTIEQLAKEVILGKWGTGAIRKKRLTDAGYDYDAVQKRVNQLMK